MTVKELIEHVTLLRVSVADGEIEGCTIDDFEKLEVIMRVQFEDGTTTMGTLSDVSVDAGCAEDEVLMLDGEGR